MRGRLPRLFILLTILLVFSSQNLLSQANKTFKSLSAKQRKSIKKEIKSMTIDKKILSFTCLNSNFVGKANEQVGGLMLNPRSYIDDSANYEVRFYNTAGLIYQTVPFPSSKTITQSNLINPDWLPAIFLADYLLEIDESNANVLYFGLDTTGVFTDVTTYFSWDGLTTSLIKHDYIYTSDSPEVWLDRFDGKTGTPFLKNINNKLRISLSNDRLYPRTRQSIPPSKKDALRWIWDIYKLSISTNSEDILPISNLDNIHICSFNFGDIFKDFNNTLLRYTEIANYKAEDLSKNDISRLSAYDLVIMPIINLSAKEKNFIREISLKTKVVLVQFEAEAEGIIDIEGVEIMSVPLDNWLTQILAAEKIFATENDNQSSDILRYGIPELVGISLDSLSRIELVIEEAIKSKAIPGCQLLVAKDGYVVWNKAFGYQTYDSLTKATESTIYDFASITKVLATTQGMMFLLDQEKINLDDRLSKHLPYLIGTNKKNITIRQVMAHQANLYPYYSFWNRAKKELISKSVVDRNIQVGKSLWVDKAVSDSILIWAAKSELLSERIDTITHEQYLYSDIGFYLLKDLIERKTEQRLDTFLAQNLYKPVGTNLVFNPTCYFPTYNIAPTEWDSKLRHEQVRGFVHDRNAALLGGVAGQAGLFGNANDVAKILQLQLNGGQYGGNLYYKSSTVEQFLSRQYDNNRRALGWDRPGPEPGGPVSELASDETFGHTGFTGGSIWADPKENLIFVFLSNRIYPSAENTKLIDQNIRTRIQDLVYRSIIK
jgi:CubicO group peptidase (beta-lactamase class C family)